MINILLEGFDIDAPWLYDELKNYIQPNHSVAVVAFSFRDNRVKSLSDWNALYSKECGKYHDGIVGGFTTYGIPEEKINFINYFTDTKESAAQKIKSADIVYFLGGLPDRMMDRSQYHQLCWWFAITPPGSFVFPPKGGLTNRSFLLLVTA